ncbi:hypothetical protein HanXRQr2_Chr13g0591031 [Helianthus annuus]|uniref:Uncharacterized protein n=1 Tax=Helianthus annuus TaxID=4232 RepID=A0A9K3EKF6_HELAN|nr:hypothetical protein HanXRQr2_Chr13g0591031 [Helianthus annuus]KAJ0481508.1 hypothetical protein HanIR_Chr13g0643291 [Helianthus annuus]KAJ0497956.1 hypothetical protein HanHA89_Chr13g0516911 [Helianthus annuus]KAJ0663960.1 hypothetical protein HanLR1_Chr13g0486781 [Helianthus annuus]KAJ0849478.1 hypothetical protein HanPSC8_Chr13g0569181 [Helianthus annuus]
MLMCCDLSFLETFRSLHSDLGPFDEEIESDKKIEEEIMVVKECVVEDVKSRSRLWFAIAMFTTIR